MIIIYDLVETVRVYLIGASVSFVPYFGDIRVILTIEQVSDIRPKGALIRIVNI